MGWGFRFKARSAMRCWLLPAAIVGAVGLMLGCAEQRIRDESQTRLAQNQYELAISILESGVRDHPESTMLRSKLIQARGDVLTRLLAKAAADRAAGDLDAAEKSLRRALALDTSGRVNALLDEMAIEAKQRKALTEIDALIKRKNLDAALRGVIDALKDNPRNPALLELQRGLQADARDRQVKKAESGLAETRSISLDFRDAGLRSVLDAVSRNSGLNFILDRDIRPDIRVTIFLRSARLEDALDLIVSTNQLAKKVLDERTILIYPNTPEKIREHQEQVVRVFYLASSDAKGAATFLRSMLKVREPFVDERINMLALRDSAENVALAERLLSLYDGQEAEVLLEVEVLEVRTSRLTELGVTFPDNFTLTPFPPSGAAALTLANVSRLSRDDIRVGVGGVTVNLKREVGDFNTLANPRIRARNREKAKILIGDKVPVVTATTGVGGFVADSVSYLDVGLKLDVEPTVYPDDDVAIRIALEVSAIAREVRTASGSLAYQIGTRNASTTLRLHNGETQLLAGLLSREERSTATRIPGIGDLPVLGRLFSSQSDDVQKTELVLAITPRILRNVRPLTAAESEIWVGTEAQPRLRAYAGRPAPSEGVLELSMAGTARDASPSVPAETKPEPVVVSKVLTSLRGPRQVNVGDTFVVALDAESSAVLRGGPIEVSYPQDRLALVEVQEGELLKQGGAATNFTQSIDSSQGTLRVGLLRSEASGAQGTGSLVQLRFKALSPGEGDVRIRKFEPVTLGASGAPHQPGAPLHVVVRP